MITFCIFPNFKGTKLDAAKVLIMCLALDAFIVLCCLNL